MTGRRSVTASAWIRAVDLDTITVLLDVRHGRVETLLGDARRVWECLAVTGDMLGAADAASVPVDRVEELVGYLTSRGLLTWTDSPRPWPAPVPGRPVRSSWGTREVPSRLDPPPVVGWRWRVRACAGLALTLAARQIGRRDRRFARLTALVGLGRRWTRPAETGEARDAVNAVRRVARLVPARVACLEESVAASVTLATAGRTATWCHGIAGDPVRLHAWITVDGHPVEEPATTGGYAPVLTVPPLVGQEGASHGRAGDLATR